MTYERAHKILEDRQREMTKNRWLYVADDISVNGKAIEALEKQISKKPIKNEWDYICPTCGQKQIDDAEDVNLFYSHCFNCGQRLDWTEVKC